MFLSLKQSEKQFFNPRYFCNAFKDWEGNPTNVYEQRDVDEFLNMFMDRLETLTKSTIHENYLKNTFGGYLSNEFICKDCPHYSEREEPFLAVSLQVKNKKTIEESLASFVEGEILEGQNAYLCEQCNKKVTAIKRICLKKLPNHLIFVLKRFEFDYDTMSKVKINEYCEFPTKINLEKYSQFGLRKKEKGGVFEEEETGFSEGYFDYELKGVVIHMGIADSGHYYSLIQDREKVSEDRWYEFNDTFVSYFDPRNIPNEAFGGEEK
jgi:ubiquitin carboxyl-terminal hydrolase 9/24